MTGQILVGLLALSTASAAMRAGVARVDITPEKPIYLSGYASRTRPSEGAMHRLWAKAVAIEDARKGRLVLVTTDIIGLPRAISDVVAARVLRQYGLDRARLVLNSSHTHTGPLIRGNLETMFDLKPEEREVVREYGAKLTEDLVAVVGAALADLQPARVEFGQGQAGFAVNRREPAPSGVKIGVNPGGPRDLSVPVLKVSSPEGRVRAILFGYACHNTTLTGEFYELSGDYAGFAQIELERLEPGATALFLMLCGGDQNPNPRSSLALARGHGEALAAEASRVSRAPMKALDGTVAGAYKIVDLRFAHHTRETFEKQLNHANKWRARNAQAMLKTYDERRPIRSYPYPVQAVRIGRGFTLLAVGGEVMIDYALRAKREFGAEGLIVAGYSNDVMAYIPSLRVLKEGGYEADDSMVYYGQPGPWADDVEERIFTGLRDAVRRIR